MKNLARKTLFTYVKRVFLDAVNYTIKCNTLGK